MKNRCFFSLLLFPAWIIVFLNIDLKSFAQEEIAMVSDGDDEFILELPKAIVKPTLADTILPTICNCGQGLLQYECFDENKEKICRNRDVSASTAIHKDYSDSEIKIVNEQRRFMEQQSIYEIQQQIRKDKMELGLGEIIQGFYMKPVY